MAAAYDNTTHNRWTLESLYPGDRIEFVRGAYSHWGIYLGGKQVIHLTGTEEGGIGRNVTSQHSFSICGKMFDKAEVRIDNFWNIVGNDKAFKNNNIDSEQNPLPPETIIERAKSMLGKVKYNVFTSNCEHFVNWCRYQLKKSDQADALVGGIGGFGLVAGSILAVVAGVGIYKHVTRTNRQQE